MVRQTDVQVEWAGVHGLGFMVQGLGFRVQVHGRGQPPNFGVTKRTGVSRKRTQYRPESLILVGTPPRRVLLILGNPKLQTPNPI